MSTLHIDLHHSKRYLICFLLVSIASIILILILNTSLWIKCGLVFMTIFYSAYIYWRYGLLQHRQSIIAIKHEDGKWFLVSKTAIFPIKIANSTTLTPWVIIINYSIIGHFFKKTCLIFSDMMTTENYRKLRVTLRYPHC